jgi:hypothetical protein
VRLCGRLGLLQGWAVKEAGLAVRLGCMAVKEAELAVRLGCVRGWAGFKAGLSGC